MKTGKNSISKKHYGGNRLLCHRTCHFADEDGDCTYDGICRYKDRNWKCQTTDEDLLTHEEFLKTRMDSPNAD